MQQDILVYSNLIVSQYCLKYVYSGRRATAMNNLLALQCTVKYRAELYLLCYVMGLPITL